MKPQMKGALKTLALLGAALACLWGWAGVRLGVWGPLGYVHALQCVIGVQPLGMWLWRGDLKPGDDIGEILEGVRPCCTNQYGEWTEYYFVPGCYRVETGPRMGEQIILLTRSNRLVRANYGGCTFDREFFNSLNADEEAERLRVFEEQVRQGAERWKKARETASHPDGS